MLDGRMLLQICFLEDVLSITNILSRVLQSDHKEFGALRRAMMFTCTQLKQVRDNPNSPLLKSFNSYDEVLVKVNDYMKQNVVAHSTRKRQKMDVNLSKDDFHKKVAVPFINALLNEMEAAFDMTSIGPVEALMVLDPVDITILNLENVPTYGVESIESLFDFYGKEVTGTYAGHTVSSPPLIFCTKESLKLEYGGYKNYLNTVKKEKLKEIETEERSLVTRLGWAKADKKTRKKKIKFIEEELSEIRKKKVHPISASDLLKDDVVTRAFPSIRYLLKLFVLVPMSEAVVERGFSRMKLILTDNRTRLDNKSLDSLMRMSYNNTSLEPEEVKHVVRNWKRQRHRRIFSDAI